MRFAPRVSLLVALLCGLCAVLLARGLTSGASSPGPSRTIVVAKAPIPPGMPLTRENLQEIRWHGTEALPGSFAHVDDLTRDGRRLALASLQRDEPILTGRVTAPNQRATLSTQLDDGMRAVAVRVDEIRGVAGFVLPGDRVDLVLTRGEGGAGGDAKAYADLLLQNVKVLAIDQVAAEGQEKPTVARAVTLELTQMEAQKVVLAQGIGRLSLILRQAGEVGGDMPLRVTASDLGPDATAERDRLAELEKQLESMRKATAEAERRDAQRLAEVEARMRQSLDKPMPSFAPPPPPPKAAAPSSIVNVIRNGSKTEQYNVAAER
jgi:pilus assembly protein CpaB